MIKGTVKILSPAGDNMAVRELMEMQLEALGDATVHNIQEAPTQEGRVDLKMDFIMDAPQGSKHRVEYCLVDFLKRFGPGEILRLKEESPQQLGF